MKKVKLIDTQEIEYDTEDLFDILYDSQKDDADLFFELALEWYEKRYKTSVGAVLLSGQRSSHYGSISGNNQNGGTLIEITSKTNIARTIIKALPWAFDDILIEYNEKKISVNTYDHDGSNHTHVRFVPQSMLDSTIEYDFDLSTYVRYNGTDLKVVNKIMKNKPFKGNTFPELY